MAQSLSLPVGGMTCASCVARVEKALAKVPGVRAASVNLATESATVEGDGALDAGVLAAAVERAGYAVAREPTSLAIEGMTCACCVARVERALLRVPGVLGAEVNLATERRAGHAPGRQCADGRPARGGAARRLHRARASRRRRHRRRTPAAAWLSDGRRVLLAALLSAPLALPMVGDLFGEHWMLPRLAATAARHAGAVLARRALLPRRLGSAARGQRQHGPARRARHERGLRPEPLHAVGRSADAMPALYFESAAVVITLVLFGKWLETRAKRQTTDAIRALQALRPDTARVRRGGVEAEIAARRGRGRRRSRRAPRRARAGRRPAARGPQPRRRVAAHRREPAGGQGAGRPRHRRRGQRRGAARACARPQSAPRRRSRASCGSSNRRRRRRRRSSASSTG